MLDGRSWTSPLSILSLVLVATLAIGARPVGTATADGDVETPALAEGARGRAVLLKLPLRRDTVVSAAKGERSANLGGAKRLKTKGIVELSLFDLEVERLRGTIVADPVLHLRGLADDPQLRVSVSTVSADWVEGTSSGYQAQRGSASFDWAEHEQRPWAYSGSDVTAVINGVGNSIWAFSDPTARDADGWQRVAIDPRVLAARVAGLSGGFALTDDVGSEFDRIDGEFRYRIFPNRFFVSSEGDSESVPYVTVAVVGSDREPPGPTQIVPVELAAGSRPNPGEAVVRLRSPADRGLAGTLGFNVRWSAGDRFVWDGAEPVARYLVPLAGEPGEEVELQLRDLDVAPGSRIQLGVQAVDGAGNLGPVAIAAIDLAGERESLRLAAVPTAPTKDAAFSPTLAGAEVAVLDPLDKVHPESGELIPPQAASYRSRNHLWDAGARRIALHAARNEFVAFQVLVETTDPVGAELSFSSRSDCTPEVELLRFVPIPSEAGWLPDPLVPLDSSISSTPDVKVRRRMLLADLFVPHDCTPGDLDGVLTLTSGTESLELAVALHVWNFTLPDHLSFVPQMNAYGLPRPPVDRRYYRLAHRHRTCLNLLPYSWRGEVFKGYKSPAESRKWREWDERFGPLLDGSAFADLPRAGVPVDAFYLPLNENWPAPLEGRYVRDYWIERSLDDDYRREFVAGVERFATHFSERGWDDTFFEFYLNNKLYHRREGWERSSAYWVFDEPINTQDFWALRWYARAFHDGVNRALGSDRLEGPKLAFRADVSRPEWQRDLLDGLLDVNVVGLGFPRYLRRVRERRDRYGEVVVNYGTSNRVERSNVQPAAWSVWAWSVGADGVLPWKTVGKESSWRKASPLALFYPGLDGEVGPHPSVRLKSYRRGQQDVEYLTLLAAVTERSRREVGELALDLLRLRARPMGKGGEDAGRLEFAETMPRDLWELRMRLAATLDRLAPPPRRRWVDLRTPPRDPGAHESVAIHSAEPATATSSSDSAAVRRR